MRVVLASLLIAVAARAGTPKPDDNATKVLDAQIDVVRGNDAAVRANYDKDAVLLGSSFPEKTVGETVEGYVQLIQTIGSVQVDEVSVDAIAGGGGDGFAWFTATATVAFSGAAEGIGELKNKGKARISQLARREGSAWKVVASLVDYGGHASKPGPSWSIGGATAPGPLAPLLASPKALAAALSNDPHVFVIGTETTERAIGPAAAKKLLASWSKLSLSIDGKVREVETKSYGFAQAYVKWTKGKDALWMQAMILAVPAGTGWRVVGVHYSGLGS